MHEFDPELLEKYRFLAGPTGCGKSEIAVALAKRIDAEIVALDSMSLYRGMDVGTAKPSRAAQECVPHHLIDVIEPHEQFSVAQYLDAARAVCRDVVDRGRTPLFVGGTGLYLRAILRGVFEGPPADWTFRRKLEAEAASRPPGYLHHRLSEVDPASAARLHEGDTRRLIRALEVFHLTGRPLSVQQTQFPLPPERRPRRVDWLSPPRRWLYDRIDRRVEAMIDAGLVDEVRRLLAASEPDSKSPVGIPDSQSPALSRTARQALGYKEIIAHLDGELTLDEAVALIQQRTRQFAKRQHTWFRNLPECTEVRITGAETAEELAERLL